MFHFIGITKEGWLVYKRPEETSRWYWFDDWKNGRANQKLEYILQNWDWRNWGTNRIHWYISIEMKMRERERERIYLFCFIVLCVVNSIMCVLFTASWIRVWKSTTFSKRYWYSLQRAFVAERNELLEQHKKKWEERMEGRRQKEIEYMKAREKRVEDYEQQLHNIRVQDSEEYNRIKIRMETDVQVKYSTYSTKKSNFV